ncbi:MAG: 2TM domain-containing protein [Proteobacteria bacterium]|nr:2TM domain-containing protein [Pseudomonadota bacterium]
MNDKHEEKIQDKIRSKVLLRDREIETEKLKHEHTRATIDALTDITDVPKHEVEAIARSVRTSHEKGVKVSLIQRIVSLFKKKRSAEKDEPKIEPFKNNAFLAHFFIYSVVNGICVFLNLRYSPSSPWFFFPLLAWGVGLANHYLWGVRWPTLDRLYRNSKKNKTGLKLRKSSGKKRSFLAHLATYGLINTMLALTNLIYSPDTLWVVFPMAGWGIPLVLHYIFTRD